MTIGYQVVTYLLDTARDKYRVPISGYSINVLQFTGQDASIQLNDIQGDAIDLILVRKISSNFNTFYLSHTAQTGAILTLGINIDLDGYPIPKTFRLYGHQEAAGTWGDVTTSKDTDAQATYAVAADYGSQNLLAGKLNRVWFQFTTVNAVTLDAVRVYEDSRADNYDQRVFKIFETPSGVSHVNGQEYDYNNISKDFQLKTKEKMYVSFEWSGATGNIQGFIVLEGERFA